MVEVSQEMFELFYIKIKMQIEAVSFIPSLQFLRNILIFHSTISSIFSFSLALVLKDKCRHKYAECRELSFPMSNKDLGE